MCDECIFVVFLSYYGIVIYMKIFYVVWGISVCDNFLWVGNGIYFGLVWCEKERYFG